MSTHTVSVVLTFAVSSVKAASVLERWWEFKAQRKRYMRERRAGRRPAVVEVKR